MEKIGDLTVLNFIAESNEFVDGKFLFASQKLEALYKKILESPALVELFLQCSEGFKYSLEMTKAFIKTPTKPGTFTPPKEPDKFLALVFGVLKEINENTLNFNVFVPKYFSEDPKTPPTQAFASQVIVPLVETIAKYFEVSAENKTHFSLEEIAEQEKENLQQNNDEEVDKDEALTETQPQQMQILFEENAVQDFNKEDTKEAPFISEPEIKSVFEQEVKSYKVTFEDLIEALIITLKDIQAVIKSSARIKPAVKTDAVFVVSRALLFAKQNDLQGVYSELVSIKYMQKHLKGLKKDIKELFEIFEYFEKL